LKRIFHFIFLASLFSALNANDAQNTQKLAKKLDLYAGTKASIQWKRVFSSQRRLEKYGLHLLTKQERDSLQTYLINHSADSEQPIVPGL